MQVIGEFKDQYRFLSNFYGGAYSVEHEYQKAKATNDRDAWFVYESPTPGEAKRRGKMITLRDDWEIVKFDVMMELLEKKFTIRDMAQKLLSTGDEELVEGNYWHDTTWGVCNCAKHQGEGENMLGQMLMDIRRRLKSNELKLQ